MLLLACCINGPSYVGPARMRTTPANHVRMAASTIEKCKGDDTSLAEAAKFFVDGFWASGTTTSKLDLNDAELEQLCKQQTDDVRCPLPSPDPKKRSSPA